ncbi:MAG TPA: undecaprenyl-phosphate glucose phosphotransferase [Thermomicrobiaceae bacterium]|nr:undecaprenyl-phosphate glucose phosphotransferase [Thermomicrobiaceae bacterium]
MATLAGVLTRQGARAQRFGRLIVAGRAVSDAMLILLAFVAGYWLRYRWQIGGQVLPGDVQPFDFFIGKALMLMVATVAIFQLRGLYRLPRWTGLLDEASVIASGATTGMALVILYSFLQRFYPSRLIFIYTWLLVIVFLLGKRLITRQLRGALWRRGIGVDRILVVGAGRAGQRYMQQILNSPQAGYQMVGFVHDEAIEDNWGIATERRVERPPYLGTIDRVPEIVRQYEADEIVIALPPNAHAQVHRLIAQCREHDVAFTLVPDLFDLALDHVVTHDLGGLPLITLNESRIRGWNYGLKRAMDIVIASSILVSLSWLMALIALAIRLDSPGPVFFTQERVGKGRRSFIIYKFRTMHRDAEFEKADLQAQYNVGDLLFKIPDDPRRTRVGRVLRRTSLDELPQFINILLGDMSVVGPRPQVPEEVAKYEEWHYHRLEVTPGLTGLWQVSGRSDLSFDEMVKLDLYYAEHWSPWLDIKLILRTFPAVFVARGAY